MQQIVIPERFSEEGQHRLNGTIAGNIDCLNERQNRSDKDLECEKTTRIDSVTKLTADLNRGLCSVRVEIKEEHEDSRQKYEATNHRIGKRIKWDDFRVFEGMLSTHTEYITKNKTAWAVSKAFVVAAWAVFTVIFATLLLDTKSDALTEKSIMNKRIKQLETLMDGRYNEFISVKSEVNGLRRHVIKKEHDLHSDK